MSCRQAAHSVDEIIHHFIAQNETKEENLCHNSIKLNQTTAAISLNFTQLKNSALCREPQASFDNHEIMFSAALSVFPHRQVTIIVQKNCHRNILNIASDRW